MMWPSWKPERPGEGYVATVAKTPDADEEAVLRFVEQFALVLVEAGIPRMPARVFAYVLAVDADRHTAAELAAGLRVSPAAISGAVRYLVQVGLLGKEREPGSRSDHYRVYEQDIWSTIMRQQDPVLKRTEDVLARGLGLLDETRPGGRRVRETLEFYRFIRSDLKALLDRWSEHRRELLEQEESTPLTRRSTRT
jgi:DNA-binding transcriptional regulator GbsR (MarR family)